VSTHRHCQLPQPTVESPCFLRRNTPQYPRHSVLGSAHTHEPISQGAASTFAYSLGIHHGDDPVDELHPPQQLAALLPRADWLIIACPLTAETRGLVDAGLLARLPPGARIINMARGEIIDEAALVDALRDGRLGGACLDVFAKEPLPEASPLWDLPNVLVSPHNSAAAQGNNERVYRMFMANLECWLQGRALGNEVRGISTGG